MVKKPGLEQKPITELTFLCLQQGLNSTGDKETLIARLLGKKKPEPEPEPDPEPEPVVEPPAADPEPEPETEPASETEPGEE